MKKKNTKPAHVGSFEILKEEKETYVKWDVDMDPNFYQFCLDRGLNEIKKKPFLAVQIGFVSVLEAAYSSKKLIKKKAK